MNRKIRAGLIGLGAIGQRVAADLAKNADIEIAALCDRVPDGLERVSKLAGEVPFYQNHLDLLAEEKLDLVYVAVPPKYHHQIVLDAISSGVHVLCEKPLANTYDEAKEMRDAAENAGVVHAINFPMVYTNIFAELKDKLASGELGTIKKLEVNLHFAEWPRPWQQNNWIDKREQGGFIREVTPHFIQLLQALFGGLEVTYSAVDYPADETLCETGFISRLKTMDGIPVLFNGLSGIGQAEHLSLKIFGDRGTLDLQNWSRLYRTSAGAGAPVEETVRAKSSDLSGELVKAIRKEPAELVDFEAGLKVQEVLEDILSGKNSI